MRPVTSLLQEIPELAATVFQTWDAPNPSPRADRHTRNTPGSRPPTRLDVWDALRTDTKGDLALLHGWAITIDEVSDGELAPIPEATPTWVGVCRYLAETWPWWRTHDLADDCETEIRHVSGRLKALARTPREVVLPCPTWGCQGVIRPTVTRREDGSRRLEADDCTNGHPVDRHEIARRSVYLADYTLPQVSERTGVPERTLRHWAQQGWIQPSHGRKFNLEAVMRFIEMTGRTASHGQVSSA